MTSYKEYKQFLIDIFGVEGITLEESDFIENNIVGAIRHHNQAGKNFRFFTKNFKSRLTRLKTQFERNDEVLNDIIIKAQNIAKKKWFGEYSELVVYDFFSSFFDLETELTIEKERTYASILPGRVASSFDGKISKNDFEQIFEVKSLTDVSKAMIDNIIKAAKSRNEKVWEITAGYNQDIEYSTIEDNFSTLLEELNETIQNNEAMYSPVGFNLTFRIYYQPKRVLTTESTYSTLHHAQSLKYFVLNHFDQLFIKEKNLLIYVVHPWFNLLNTNDFLGKKEFIEHFAQGCFEDLTKSDQKIKEVFPKWNNVDLEIKEVAQRISGILFLFDNNVVQHATFSNDNELSVIEAFLFVNNNANQQCAFNDSDRAVLKEFESLRNLKIYGC